MAKIQIFDSWKKFMPPVAEYWRSQGHEVKMGPHWGPELVEWADVAYFYPVDNNLKTASKKQEKPANTCIIAEAVDIDIYAGHLGGVNWDYVDALIFMAYHTKAFALERFSKLPPDLPVYIVPGGLNLTKWTMRRDPSRGYNIAWIGRLWIPKNVFGALQIFNQLIQTDPNHPWQLSICSDNKWHPYWWRKHTEAYLEANPEMAERVTWEAKVPDLNEWLEDKDFLLQVSMKEAFGYVVAESAAKGIKPIIQMTNGALDTWPSSWVFQTYDEAIQMFLGSYEPETYRAYIADMYPLSKRVKMLDEICGLG